MKINYKEIIVLPFIAIMLAGCMTAALIVGSKSAGSRVDPSSFKISEVVVRDSDFNIVRIINQPEQIREINRLWKELQQIHELPNTNWTDTLDIKANQYEGRWCYNRQGYLAYLNVFLEPMFKVEDPAAFNKLIFDSNSVN